MKKIQLSFALALAVSTSAAHGANREIRALFQPDPSQPGKNLFINQTPNSGYCVTFPAKCAESNMFSIELPVRFSSTRMITPGDAFSLKAPADWRPLTVTNQDTQETEVVEVRITGIGSNYVLSNTSSSLTGAPSDREGHDQLWSSNGWLFAPAPCLGTGLAGYTPRSYRFFWRTPVEAGCVKMANFPIPSMYFETLDFAYELKTPNPLSMSSGLYTGSLSYTMGPGGDFQLGGLMQPDDSHLTLDFVLDVQHTLKVDLPPGGNNVTLEPEGGWARWINSGRKPTRIFRDQPFHISASSRFKVLLLCNSTGGYDCKLGSPKGNTTNVQVYLTLPPGITYSGYNVTRMPLRMNNWAGPFQPGLYIDRKPGAIHFDMTPFDINFLLRPGVTDRLRGNVTVIWDSEA